MTPDASHYFCPERLESHVFELLHCIQFRKGFMLFTADVGLGKSTLSRYLIQNLEQNNTDVALVLNTFLQGKELLRSINEDFGLPAEGSMKELLDNLNAFLLKQYEQGRNCLIIIDDAQNLNIESLEMIRLLSNFEVSTEKLVQILLIAQPEIRISLDRPEIRQLKSRIALHIELEPFSINEVRDYVSFRLNAAGNANNVHLSSAAVNLLYKESKGYPRRINLIMDRLLYALIVSPTSKVGKKLMRLAIDDLNRANKMIARLNDNRVFKPFWALAIAAGIGSVALIATQYKDITENIENIAIDNAIAAIQEPQQNQVMSITQASNDLSTQSQPKLAIKPEVLTLNKEQNSSTNSVAQQESINAVDVNSKLYEFLELYGLQELYEPVSQQLKNSNINQLNSLLSQSPYQFIISPTKIDNKSQPVYLHSRSGNQYWVYLWQPNLHFAQYHFGLKSEKVGELQKQLMQLGFFNSQIDKTIGSKTMYAVANFQRSVGIVPTGKADPLTLFHLNQVMGLQNN